MNSKELAILVIQPRDNLLDFIVCFRLVEEVTVVDDEDESEETKYDIHMSIATNYKDKVDQLDNSHH